VSNPDLPAGAERHPSAGRPLPDTSDDRARRRELRRLERAAEVAAFAAHEAEIEAERAADEAHFEPPEPPPLPRPKGRTIGALLMLLGGLVLLVRPGLLAVGFDLTMVIAVILMLGGAVLLLTGIWKRRNSSEADGWDDGAVV
jgi:Flp pilus assembly protein TadB